MWILQMHKWNGNPKLGFQVYLHYVIVLLNILIKMQQ